MTITAKQLANLKPCKPGENRNPGGKPVGARNRLTARFLNDLADDFVEHGKSAIKECREKDAATYLRVVGALCPKELEIKRPLAELSDDDIAQLIAILSVPDPVAAAQALSDSASDGTGSQAIN